MSILNILFGTKSTKDTKVVYDKTVSILDKRVISIANNVEIPAGDYCFSLCNSCGQDIKCSQLYTAREENDHWYKCKLFDHKNIEIDSKQINIKKLTECLKLTEGK